MAENESGGSVVHDNDNGGGAVDSAAAAEPVAREPVGSPESPSFAVSEAEWAEIKALLDKRYAEIATLLRYNKTKDESIRRLGAEVQKYRDGFAFDALKPFINALIAFREDCRKSIRDAEKSPPDAEKAKKFILYLVSDFEELLDNVGLKRDGGSVSIKGMPRSGPPEPEAEKPASDPSAEEQKSGDDAKAPPGVGSVGSISELIEYLRGNEDAIMLALKDRAEADRKILDSVAAAARVDTEHYLTLVAPVSARLYGLFDAVSAKSRSVDAEPIALYMEILEDVVRETEDILAVAGIKIETLGGEFDPQKHKLVKTVPTNEVTLDRTVANCYTDCYTYEGKVVYPSKADVYKFQQ